MKPWNTVNYVIKNSLRLPITPPEDNTYFPEAISASTYTTTTKNTQQQKNTLEKETNKHNNKKC